MTGLVVEVTLAPIALYHFHKSGIFGALANMIAIPLTTFVIMPAEALALLFDTIGLGAPFWWVVRVSIEALIALAHGVATMPGAVVAVPVLPTGAFIAIVAGGLWLLLWQTRWRWWGLLPIGIGVIATFVVPPPDLLITGDGKHLAMRDDEGEYALLRPRAGDYVRDMLAENAGADGDIDALDTSPVAECSADSCVATVRRKGAQGVRRWTVLATRSANAIGWRELVDACAKSDIVVSDRWLPDGCTPRVVKLDEKALAKSGGLSITLSPWRVRQVKQPQDDHPWINPPRVPFTRKSVRSSQENSLTGR